MLSFVLLKDYICFVWLKVIYISWDKSFKPVNLPKRAQQYKISTVAFIFKIIDKLIFQQNN